MKTILYIILAWNLIVFAMMGIDKWKAIKNKRRISEFTLLLSSFAMGAIGGLAGMAVFHHKTKKAKFLILVPLALIINLVALYGIYILIV